MRRSLHESSKKPVLAHIETWSGQIGTFKSSMFNQSSAADSIVTEESETVISPVCVSRPERVQLSNITSSERPSFAAARHMPYSTLKQPEKGQRYGRSLFPIVSQRL